MQKKLLNIVLKRCAKSYLAKVSPYVIGITWSIWKTSCRMIVSHILQQSIEEVTISTSPKNFNSDTGLSLAILWITSFTPSFLWVIKTLMKAFGSVIKPNRVDVLVLEYWIDAPGDMKQLLEICVPHCAIFTWLDVVHASQFDWPDEILIEKSWLLTSAKEIVFYPAHANYLNSILEEIQVDILWYWLSQEGDDDIWFDQYQLQKDSGWRIVSTFHVDQWVDDVLSIESNLTGQISAWYTSLWVQIAMILWQRLSKEVTFPEAFEFSLQPGRFSVFQGLWWSILIDSTYNAAPASMKKIIQQTIGLRNELYSDYQLIYCLGDMNELGDFSLQEHQTLASMISQSADLIYLIWDQTIYTKDELAKIWYSSSRVHHFSSSRELWMSLKNELQETNKKYLILFKASQWWLFMEEAISQVLLHDEDKMKLPRQEKWWIKKKNDYFTNTMAS